MNANHEAANVTMANQMPGGMIGNMNVIQMLSNACSGLGGDRVSNGAAQKTVRQLQNEVLRKIRANAATLRPYEWEKVDQAIVGIARGLMTFVADCQAAGLVMDIDGMSSTFYRYDTTNDFNAAQVAMRPGQPSNQDGVEFGSNYIPLPITWKDYSVGVRELEESRKSGQGLDVTGAQIATKKVIEKIEETLLTGLTYIVGGKTLYGVVNHTNVNGITLSTYGNWDASAGDGGQIMKCVNAMLGAAFADHCYGPFLLEIPQAYAVTMNYTENATTGRKVGQAILELTGLGRGQTGQGAPVISGIRVSAKLAANTVALIPLDPLQFQIIRGLEITNVPWSSPDGSVINNRIMAIYVPWVKADQDGNTGIVKAA